MSIEKNTVDRKAFNRIAQLPYELRLDDFAIAMQDVYDFFYDVDKLLASKGLQRLDDMLRPAGMSGTISDMLSASIGKHSRVLVQNRLHNGHPDLIVGGVYPNDSIKAGEAGVEVKATRGGPAVDTHGARRQWLCVFSYMVDTTTEPAIARNPLTFTAIYLAQLKLSDFRKNQRSELGTRTASPNRSGVAKLRANWIYRLPPSGSQLGERLNGSAGHLDVVRIYLDADTLVPHRQCGSQCGACTGKGIEDGSLAKRQGRSHDLA
jgi:hypothetical protein